MDYYYIYASIKMLSKEGVVTVENNILSEILSVLDGLDVKYSTKEFNHEAVTNIILD